MKYNIYAGLSGSLGGAAYEFTEDFSNHSDAEEEAYLRAIEIYESYEGLHGIPSYEDIENEYITENSLTHLSNEDYDVIEQMYIEERENWLDYYVIPTEEDTQDNLLIYGNTGEVTSK